MKYSEFKYLVQSDLYRSTGSFSTRTLVKRLMIGEGFKYSFWMRLCAYTRSSKALKFTIYPIALFFFRHVTYKYGISIPFKTKIGSGFYIGHFGGIVVNEASVIGKNCNISHGVTLGQANRGRNKGYPVLGDDIYIGPGAKIVGAVTIGNNVAIGANCVVTRDIPDNSVVVGIPGKVISQDGAQDYVNRTDYDRLLKPATTVD